MKKIILCLTLSLLFVSATFAATYRLVDSLKIDTLKKDTAKKTTVVLPKKDTIKFIPNMPIVVKQFSTSTTTSKGGKVSAKAGSVAQSSSLSAGNDAGRTNGSLDVSGSGAATYTVPIVVPPGINGVAPQIALSYNSQGGNGVVGYGWNISGISAITRIPRTLFHDGVVGGTNGDINDRYALDGQRLVIKSGSYGADGAEYQTENYSNIRVVSRGATWTGPQYFDVYYPDGSHAVYGQNSDSYTRNTFAINYMDNLIGARISYSYTKTNETVVISQINYGALSSGTTMNQISFTYTTRSRNEQNYIGSTSLYQTALLSEINVKVSGTGYRNYVLDHDVIPDLNYDRLTGIQELSGDRSKSFDPIIFNYNPTNETISRSSYTTGLSYVSKSNYQTVTADFTGNGKMDLLLYPNAKNHIFLLLDPAGGTPYTQPVVDFPVDPFEDVFSVSTLDANNRLFSGQGFTIVHQPNVATVNFDIYLPGVNGSNISSPTQKVWSGVPSMVRPRFSAGCSPETTPSTQIPRSFFSGDFNGDGLTDVISINMPYTQLVSITDDGNGGCTINTSDVDVSTVHFINLDRRVTSGFVKLAGTLAASYTSGDKIIAADFNGDGKTDLVHITAGSMYVYGLDAGNNLTLLWTETDGAVAINYEPLLGDFNGDGKTDIMFPTANGSSSFALFTSTGNGFQRHDLTFGFSYNTPSVSGTTTTFYNLTANDFNGDGKTDIISSSTVSGLVSMVVYNNTGTSNAGEPTFTAGASTSGAAVTNLSDNPISLFFSNTESNFASEYGIYSGDTMTLFRHDKDTRQEVAMSSVSQNGVSTTVNYNMLASGTLSADIPLYQSSSTQSYAKQVYPYVDIETQPGLRVVSQLTRTYAGPSGDEVLSQYFGYNGGVTHADGLGFLGFNETTRTNWNTGTSDVNRMFITTVFDMKKRGAVSRSFVSKTQFDSSSPIKNTPASKPDTVLSSAVTTAQTIVASHSITLNPGFSANGANGTFMAKLDDPVSGINDGGTSTSNYITRTDYTYNTSTDPTSKVFTNNPTTIVTKDLLNQTNTVTTYAYDGYNNITNQTSNFSGAGTKATQITYANSPGSYIGRVIQKDETSTIGGDSFSTEVQYTYTGFLATQIKRKGNGTPFITEDNVYDSYGNVTSKTVSTPSDGSRATSMAYDLTGRFNTSVTDVQGLTATMSYNAVTGTLTSKTNPYGQATGYTYDAWGRQLITTNYLGHTNTRKYDRSGSNITISDTGDDQSASSTTINALGQTNSTTTKDVLGQVVGKGFLYDAYGRQISASEPGIGGNYSQYNLTDYDEYGRVKKVTEYTGKVTDISYAGLVTTVSDGTKTVTTTKNAMGVVISTSDPGGTINNTYFGNGNLKSADYGGSTQLIEQDGWGHKTKLTDPSAGIYTYTYNQFGETKTATTPKGSTTYAYDAYGKVVGTHITGDATNMTYVYSYDGTTKLPTTTSLTNTDGNNTNYTYSYDGNKSLISTVEDNLHAVFTKTVTYDGYGRVATETSQAQNKTNSLTASKSVTNNYQNGQVKSISDNSNSAIIWEVSAQNARGQATTALLGTALKQTNVFDGFGYPSELKTENVLSTPFELMKLNYSFSATRGNLSSRSNTAVSPTWSETFSYDTQDRLTNYNDNTANHSQNYDGRGRVTNNSQVGDYQYTGTSYKQDKVTNLTPFAAYHYQNDHLQQIAYNAFKAPVTIDEAGIEKISFQYNGGLSRSHMYYGDTTADKDLRRMHRHYSEDGSMEITEDITNSKTSFVFYMGGNAYNAPALWKKEIAGGTSTTDGLYYLLRDHLGSIVMITNASGAVQEKRQFDAWGNIVKLENGAGTALTALGITDRGYTGHEHLQRVGLINMNARLYDPILHRFLAPDAVIQDMGNTQNYNRYAYVFNNPLKYADPSGNRTKDMQLVDPSPVDCSCGMGGYLNTTGMNAARAQIQGIQAGMGIDLLGAALTGDPAAIAAYATKTGGTTTTDPAQIAAITTVVNSGFSYILFNENVPLNAGQGGGKWDSNHDGFLELNEANIWYREGNGQAITVSASTINLSKVNPNIVNGMNVGTVFSLHLLGSNFNDDGVVYGTLDARYLGGKSIEILPNMYDFDIGANVGHPWSSEFIRNAATWMGEQRAIGFGLAGDGKPFMINFSGTATIGQGTSWPNYPWKQ